MVIMGTKRNSVFRVLKTRKAKLSCGYSEQHITEGFANFFFRSTIFLQDGHEINEIPIIIRRMGPNEILFQNELYGGRPQLHTFFLEQTLWFVVCFYFGKYFNLLHQNM